MNNTDPYVTLTSKTYVMVYIFFLIEIIGSNLSISIKESFYGKKNTLTT